MSLVSNRLEKSTDRCRNLSFEIKTSFADLDLIREEWDQFVLSVDGGVFFSYDWCKIWWKYYSYKRKLRIFIFRDCGEIKGIVPIVVDKIWLGVTWIKVAKLLGSDSTLSVLEIPVLDLYSKNIQTNIEMAAKFKGK